MLLEACLNGRCTRDQHPRCPITPAELAAEAAAATAAGAMALHVHPRDADGHESLAADDVAAAVDALREIVDDVPVGVTTGAWIVPDPGARLRLVAGWSHLPDTASVNFHEEGAVVVAQELLAREVEIEAGVASVSAASVLVSSGLAEHCVRILVEPPDATTEAALATVDAIEHVLDGVAPEVPRLLHGHGATAWDLLAEAARRGCDIRTGLEDTLRMPDGSRARANADLVRAAVARYREAELAV